MLGLSPFRTWVVVNLGIACFVLYEPLTALACNSVANCEEGCSCDSTFCYWDIGEGKWFGYHYDPYTCETGCNHSYSIEDGDPCQTMSGEWSSYTSCSLNCANDKPVSAGAYTGSLHAGPFQKTNFRPYCCGEGS